MLRIEAAGKSIQERNEKRGKLFEKLCRVLLRSLGYEVRLTTRVNYAGMEIDIEGEKTIEKTPFIGECKAYSSDISATLLQQFAGKLTSKWLKDKTMQGIFIVLPRLNSSARGLYNQNFKNEKDFILRVLEEEDVLESIFRTNLTIKSDKIREIVSKHHSLRLGDLELIYTERGFYWFQYLINNKNGIADRLCILDSKGEIIREDYLAEYLQSLSDDFSGIKVLPLDTKSPEGPREKAVADEIVKIHGSSSWFEYQFPASPAYFVGRKDIIKEFLEFINNVINSKTDYRSIVINGNSGWGKSSCILKLADVAKGNSLIVPIDTRTANSSRFLLYAVKYVFDEIIKRKFIEVEKDNSQIGGYESLYDNLGRLDNALKKDKKTIIIFFDQFENIFYQPSILEKFRNFALKLNDKQYNIIAGFSWKIDLVGITHDFPYILRDNISKASKIFDIQKFGELETQAIIKALGKEIRSRVRKDLEFRLSEFSQGLPWLLKKLCAHIIKQKAKGVSQIDLANKLLNIRELFDADLSELSPRERSTLEYISQRAPISIREIGEVHDDRNLISSLIDKRLIVRVGPKYDIYWDLFKDYLNTGKLPSEETYILRASPNSLLAVLKEFLGKEEMPVPKLIEKGIYTEKTIYNILKDAKLLNLVEIKENEVKPLFKTNVTEQELLEGIKHLIKEKLGKHKIVNKISNLFLETATIHIEKIVDIFREVFPYIKADQKTWDTYARILGRWIDFVDYGIYGGETVKRFDPESDVKSTYTFAPRYKRPGFFIPQTQYKPIEELMERIGDSIKNRTPIDVSKSRMRKALASAAGLEFLKTKENTIMLTQLGFSFIKDEEKRGEIFKNAVLKIEISKKFMEISKKSKQQDIVSLSKQLNSTYGNRWKEETAKGITKILINWMKHAGIIIKKKARNNRQSQLKLPGID